MTIFETAYRIVKFRLYKLTGRGIKITDWKIEEGRDIECMYHPELENDLIDALQNGDLDGIAELDRG